MRKTVMLVALVLAGCQTTAEDQRAQQQATDNRLASECARAGYRQGTREFEDCKATRNAVENSGAGLNAGHAIWLGSILGAAVLLSDQRLKRDIELVGTYRGFNLYSYRYLWSDTLHYGVMAQEVQALRPDAVVEIDGYLAVHYDRL